MKVRIVVTAALGALVLMLAGCGPAEYKPQTTGGEEQQKMIKEGQPLAVPSGAPGMDKLEKR